MNDDQTSSAAAGKTALEVTPYEARNKYRRRERCEQKHLHIPALELLNWIAWKIDYISKIMLPVGLKYRPVNRNKPP